MIFLNRRFQSKLFLFLVIYSTFSYIQACSQKLQLGGSFEQNCGPFKQNSDKSVVFSSKIINILTILWLFQTKYQLDLFGKNVDLLFERGLFPHLENPPWLRA